MYKSILHDHPDQELVEGGGKPAHHAVNNAYAVIPYLRDLDAIGNFEADNNSQKDPDPCLERLTHA